MPFTAPSRAGLALAGIVLAASMLGIACSSPAPAPEPAPAPTPLPARTPVVPPADSLAVLDSSVRDPAAWGIRPPPATGGTLRLATGAPPVNLDPHASIADPAWLPVLAPVYEPLVAPRVTPLGDPLGEEFVCRLCTSWTVDKTLTEWTFTLRPGVTWHDGQPLSTLDVVSSLQRAMDRARRWGLVTQRLAMVQAVEAPAAGQVRIVTRTPTPDLLESLTQVMIVPRHVLAKDEGALRAYAIGTGPFRIRHWDADHILLEAWTGYHQPGRPWLDHVSLAIHTSAEQRQALFLAGSLDVITASSGQARPLLEAAGGPGQGHAFPAADLLHLVFDASRPPWSDVRVRRAVAAGLDGEALRLAAGGMTMTPPPLAAAARPWALPPDALPPGMAAAGRPEALTNARTLLVQAGQGLPLRARLLVPATPASAPLLAGAIQASLQPAGVQLEVEILEPGPLLRLLQARNFDLAIRSYGSYRGTDAFSTLLSGGPANVAGVADPELDGLIRRQQREARPGERIRLLQDAQRRILDQAWLIPLPEATAWTIWQPGVHNVAAVQRGAVPVFLPGAAEILWREP